MWLYRGRDHVRPDRPHVRRRIVDPRRIRSAAAGVAAGDQHLAVRKQRRRVPLARARARQPTRRRPRVRARVIQLGRRHERGRRAAHHEHLAVVEPRRRMVVTPAAGSSRRSTGRPPTPLEHNAGQRRQARRHQPKRRARSPTPARPRLQPLPVNIALRFDCIARASTEFSAPPGPNWVNSRMSGRRGVQSGEAARAAATASSRELTPRARNSRRMWFLTVSVLRCNSAAICLVERPCSSRRSTST